MASPSTARVSFCNLFLFVCTATSIASAAEYIVGDERGWNNRSPPALPNELFYTWWADLHTFYVGDRLNFNNETDTVQLVNRKDYINCNTSNPIQELKGNNTVFELRKLGYHHFISGEADNCLAGQKMMVLVVHDGYKRTFVTITKHYPSKLSFGACDIKIPFTENRTRDDKDIATRHDGKTS